MIHDATVEVTCDAVNCLESVYIEPHFTYYGVMHAAGSYDTSDAAIERQLQNERWIVREGKHYCSEDCAQAETAA